MFPECSSSLAQEAGSSQQYSCKEVYGNTVSGDCMFLYVFEDEQKDIKSLKMLFQEPLNPTPGSSS